MACERKEQCRYEQLVQCVEFYYGHTSAFTNVGFTSHRSNRPVYNSDSDMEFFDRSNQLYRSGFQLFRFFDDHI